MSGLTIATALGGRRAGSGWMARCPAHDDRTPSLSIGEAEGGKVLVHCHAGCNQERVIAALKTRDIWNESRTRPADCPLDHVTLHERSNLDDAKRTRAALALWKSAVPASGTNVETYLSSRALTLKPPTTLRFHPGLRHPSGGVWPAMLALVTRGAGNTEIGIHRTFIAPDGKGKAPVSAQKMMLGPCRGAAVRLAETSGVLMVGEGIETCLSVMQSTSYPAWAALSSSGLQRP